MDGWMGRDREWIGIGKDKDRIGMKERKDAGWLAS